MPRKTHAPAKSSRRNGARRRTTHGRVRTGDSAAAVLRRYTPPRESIGYFVREVYRGFARALQKRIVREGVSIGIWLVLRMLWEEDGLTQRQLSERVGINGPTVVTAINSMEKAGLVRRAHNRHDRRKTNIFLTGRGRRLKHKLWPMAREVYAIAFKGIDRGAIDAMGRFLTQVWANLETDRRQRRVQ